MPLETKSLETLKMLPCNGEYVFQTPDGNRYHFDSYLKPLKRAVRRAKINKRVDIHTMCHSYASNKIRAGWGIRKVSQILGHSDISITADVYTHLLDGDLKVKDEFRFVDKENSSANILKLEEHEETLMTIAKKLIHSLQQVSVDSIQESLVAQVIQDAIQLQRDSNGTDRESALRSSENSQNAPQRRKRRGSY